MKKALFLVALLFSSNAFCFELESTYEKDVTYDGIAEKIICKVGGESWDAIDWTFSIYDHENLIYQFSTDEKYWKMVDERGDFQECKVLADCKKETYNPDSMVRKFFEDFSADDITYGASLHWLLTYGPEAYGREFGVTKSDGEKYAKRLYEYLKGNEIIGFTAPDSYGYGGLLTYDKFLEQFVTIYTP